MTEGKLDVRQSRTRDLLDQIATSVDVNGDNLLRSINKELTPPFAMQVTGTHAIQVGAISVQNPETLENRIAPPISGEIPFGWTVGNITIPASNNNNITNDTGGPAVLLNITTGHYVRMGISINKLGQIVVTLGDSNLTLASATAPKIPANTVALGFAVLQNVGGTIQDVTSASLFTYNSGGSGTGVVEGVILNNQTTPLAIPDFIVDSADSKIFTVEFSIIRNEGAAGELVTQGTLRGIYRDTTGWELVGETFAGDDPGVTFSIDSVTGQVKYTSTNASVFSDRFVAVSFSGDPITYSDDGTVWATATGINSNQWRDIVYSPGLNRFAAISSNGSVGTNTQYSDDGGVTWNAGSGEPTSGWRGIAWSPSLNLFVAVGNDAADKVMHSSDGITWSDAGISGVPVFSNFNAVSWSPSLGLFVAVAEAGASRDMYSSDGLTWATATSIDTAVLWNDVEWSPGLGLFVAVGAGGAAADRIQYSSDGMNWTSSTTIPVQNYSRITWSEDLTLFVAMGTLVGDKIFTSPDGDVWTVVAGASASTHNGLAWSSGIGTFAAIRSGASLNSTDGVTWNPGGATTATSWNNMTTGAVPAPGGPGTIKFKKLEL